MRASAAPRLSGRVVPLQTVEVGSLVSGLVMEVSCDEGQAVRAGQRCAKIDARPFEAAAQREEAGLRAALAREAKDREALTYATSVLARARGLLPDGVVSQEAVEAAADTESQARAQLDIDLAGTAQARATLRSALLDLARTDIVAPIDGTVAERRVNVGQAIVAALQAPTLFVVSSAGGNLGVEVTMACEEGVPPPIGTTATVAVDGSVGEPMHGRVRRVGGLRCPANTAARVVSIEVDDPRHRLVPGMRAHVTLDPATESR